MYTVYYICVMCLRADKKDPTCSDIMEIESKSKSVNSFVKLMKEYRIYGMIQLNCVRALVACVTRKEISSGASGEVLKLTLTAMTNFSWNSAIQLEGLYLLGYLLSQFGEFPL